MTKQEALKLWDTLYLEEEKAYDYASHPMKREDYENENSAYGWTVDQKQVIPIPGKKLIHNFIPCSIVTKFIRDNKTSFKIGNFLFEVRKGKTYGQYDIYDVTDISNPINMEPSDENQDPEYNKRRRELMSKVSSKSVNEKINEDLKQDSKVETNIVPKIDTKNLVIERKEEIKPLKVEETKTEPSIKKEENKPVNEVKETKVENIKKEENKPVNEVKETKVEVKQVKRIIEYAPMFKVVNIVEK